MSDPKNLNSQDAPRILVVDDEVIVAEDLRVILKGLGYQVVGMAFNYEQALKLAETKKPKLALVDIQLREVKDGISLATELRDRWNIPVVFVTSNADEHTVQRAKSAGPVGYVVKPFEKRDLYAAVEMALARINGTSAAAVPESEPEDLFVKSGEGFEKVAVADLLWLKAEGNYTELHTAGRRYVVRGNVKETLEQLNSDFIRIHKSYAVRLPALTGILPDYALIGDERIPIGKSFRDGLMDRIRTMR